MAIKTFTSGAILTASDTNTFLANSGLVYVTSVAVGSGVTTQNVPNAFNANFDNYRIVISNVDCSIDGNGVKLKLDGITTAVYSSASVFSTYSGAAPTGGGYVNDAGGIQVGITSITNDTHCIIDICSPFVASRKTYTYQTSNANVCGSGGGYVNSSLSATGFTIDPDGATTMTGGFITVFGYRKA